MSRWRVNVTTSKSHAGLIPLPSLCPGIKGGEFYQEFSILFGLGKYTFEPAGKGSTVQYASAKGD